MLELSDITLLTLTSILSEMIHCLLHPLREVLPLPAACVMSEVVLFDLNVMLSNYCMISDD